MKVQLLINWEDKCQACGGSVHDGRHEVREEIRYDSVKVRWYCPELDKGGKKRG